MAEQLKLPLTPENAQAVSSCSLRFGAWRACTGRIRRCNRCFQRARSESSALASYDHLQLTIRLRRSRLQPLPRVWRSSAPMQWPEPFSTDTPGRGKGAADPHWARTIGLWCRRQKEIICFSCLRKQMASRAGCCSSDPNYSTN